MLVIRREQMHALDANRLDFFQKHLQRRLELISDGEADSAGSQNVPEFLAWVIKTAPEYGIESEIDTARFAEMLWRVRRTDYRTLPRRVLNILYSRLLKPNEKLDRALECLQLNHGGAKVGKR